MTEHIDEAAWLAMVSHPFRLQAGGQRIDQQLCYLGTLLQVWETAAAFYAAGVGGDIRERCGRHMGCA